MRIEMPSMVTVILEQLKKEVVVKCGPWDPFTTSPLAVKRPAQPTQAIFKTLPKVRELKPDDVVVITAENRGSLLVRTKECHSFLKEINQELRSLQAERCLKPVEVNQLAVCNYNDDNLYRVVVLKLNGATAVVHYIDYGDIETTPVNNLKAINAKLASIDITVIKITLKGFLNGKFSPAVLQYLAESSEKRVKFSVVCMTDNSYDLKLRDGSCLSEKLIALDSPKIVTKQVSPVPPPPLSDFIDMYDIPTAKVNMGSNEAICVDTSNIVDGTATFWLTSTAPEVEDLEKVVMDQIAKDATPYHPSLHEACLAKLEDEWFRAAVVDIKGDTYGLFFVDYGSTLYLTAKDIRKITREIAQIKCYGMWCILDGVKQADEPINESLLSKIKVDLLEQTNYVIDVMSVDCGWYTIKIPSLHEVWKKEGLL